MSKLDNIKDAIQRHFSGENPPETMVANDAIQDGAAAQGGSDAQVNKGQQSEVSDQRDDCAECHKPWSNIKLKTPPLQCSFREQWVCAGCTKIKKSDLALITRDDIFWACQSCVETVKSQAKKMLQPTKHIIELDETMAKLESSIEKKIEKAINTNVTHIVEKCLETLKTGVSETVNTNMTKLWSETLGDPADFPALDSDISKEAPIKPKLTLSNVVKNAVRDQKNEELKRENRMNNIVIFRIPEQTEPDASKRKEIDQQSVQNLLSAIGVDAKPKQTIRLGAYKNETNGSPRPLKVTFEDQETQQEIFKNLPKLKDASPELKNMSIAYDLSEDERQTVRDMVKVAKEKSSDSPNWEYKIRGPPWDLKEVRYRKRTNVPTPNTTTQID